MESIFFDFKDQYFHGMATGFKKWFNQFFLSSHTPHHNGYDEIYRIGETQYIRGKFQYGDLRKDLQGECISIYLWSLADHASGWRKIGRARTDGDGRIGYRIPVSHRLGQGIHLVKLFVEGDGTSANMYIEVLEKQQKYVVFDMDGTLTTDDMEQVKEYLNEMWNGAYMAKPYDGAVEVVKYYRDQGFPVIYLTARPYWLAERSQKWLMDHGFPRGILRTYSGATLRLGLQAERFKTLELRSLAEKGVLIHRAYGNASSDIKAYYNIGLTGEQIFIIGPNAGDAGTTPVSDYPAHLKSLEG